MIKLFENFVNSEENENHINKNKGSYDFLVKCNKFFEKIIEDDDVVRMKFVPGNEYVSIVTSDDIFTVLINGYVNIFYDEDKVHDKYPFIFKYLFETLSVYLEKINNYTRKGIDGVEAYFDMSNIDDIEFDVDDYNILKDSERFGL